MATFSTPARQPFGILDDAKLRSLQSIKNRQNAHFDHTTASSTKTAITPSPAQSLKRRAPSPENSDSENIDPFHLDSTTKRKRAAFDDDVSLAKHPRLHTHVIPSNTKIYTPPAPTRQSDTTRTGSTPLSAPPAAGRSPTRPHNRFDKSQPKRRFAPPSLRTSSPSISIAAALRGTLAHKRSAKSKRQAAPLVETKPASWSFDIFEESEEQQDYRMSEWTMTQSSAALELSDDEAKGSCFDTCKKLDKGKENVDPNEMSVTTAPITRAVAAAAAAEAVDQKDIKAGEPRTPLGDLNAAEFYAEGLDATSVVLVQDDAPRETTTPEQVREQSADAEPIVTLPESATADSTPQTLRDSPIDPEIDLSHEPIPEWAQQASHNADDQVQQEDSLIFCDETAEPADCENWNVWESESAKDENENENRGEQSRGCVLVGEGQTISLSAGPYLQEI